MFFLFFAIVSLMEIEFAGQNESSYEVSVIHNREGEGHLFMTTNHSEARHAH